MPKYYIKCGTLELIHSTTKDSINAAATALWETNKFDILDEYFYVDERGYKDYTTADSDTKVIKTSKVCKLAGWQISKDDE